MTKNELCFVIFNSKQKTEYTFTTKKFIFAVSFKRVVQYNPG